LGNARSVVQNRASTSARAAPGAEATSTSEETRRVTGMKRTTEKNLMVFSGRAYPELSEEVVELLECGLVPQDARAFANGELYVRYEESVRGCDAFVIQSHTSPINDLDHGARC
jgi:hypothetical protein